MWRDITNSRPEDLAQGKRRNVFLAAPPWVLKYPVKPGAPKRQDTVRLFLLPLLGGGEYALPRRFRPLDTSLRGVASSGK